MRSPAAGPWSYCRSTEIVSATISSLLRPRIPEFTVLGGMMVDHDDVAHLQAIGKSIASTIQSVRRIGCYLRDRIRYPRGACLVKGNALVARLCCIPRASFGVTVRVGVETVAIEHVQAGWTLDLRRNGATTVPSPRTVSYWPRAASAGIWACAKRCFHGPFRNTARPRQAIRCAGFEGAFTDGVSPPIRFDFEPA